MSLISARGRGGQTRLSLFVIVAVAVAVCVQVDDQVHDYVYGGRLAQIRGCIRVSPAVVDVSVIVGMDFDELVGRDGDGDVSTITNDDRTRRR